MPPSATRVASRFHSATVGYRGTWAFLPQESKEVALGAWVYHLRQALNGRPGTVFLGGRPKPTKITVDGDARLRLVGFAVPDVGFVEYDPDRRQVRVLSRSGSVLVHENVNVRFDLTTSALKEAGKKLAYHSSLLLSDIKVGEPDRARTREQEQQAETDRAVRQKAELAERAKVDRMMANERQWVASLVQYLDTVPRKRATLDKGYMGGPYQTSNTTTEQVSADIGPWLASVGITPAAFAKALSDLSPTGLNAIRGVLGPAEIRGAPIVRSGAQLGLMGSNLALTYRETIYYN